MQASTAVIAFGRAYLGCCKQGKLSQNTMKCGKHMHKEHATARLQLSKTLFFDTLIILLIKFAIDLIFLLDKKVHRLLQFELSERFLRRIF